LSRRWLLGRGNAKRNKNESTRQWPAGTHHGKSHV